jgi:ribonuclease D
MEAVERARALPESELPARDKPVEQLRAPGAVVDLLRTLLRLKAEQAGVAGRLVASADEIDRLAAGKRDRISCATHVYSQGRHIKTIKVMP